ncbi:MAG: YidH family protein [Nodosilinea sp.]
MTDSMPQKPINTTNELAKERNRAAAERTINAWLGICLSLIGFGIAFDQIFRSLRRRFPAMEPAITKETATLIGMGFVGWGLVLLGIALVQHRLAIKSIARPDYLMLSTVSFNRVVAVGIVLLGIAGLVATLFLI